MQHTLGLSLNAGVWEHVFSWVGLEDGRAAISPCVPSFVGFSAVGLPLPLCTWFDNLWSELNHPFPLGIHV